MIISYPPTMRRQLLSKHFLISTMPERALDDLVKFSTVVRFEPHRDVFNKGEPGDCLYGILSGRVRIYSTSPEGSEIMLNVLETGELFGEIAILDGRTRTASAAAMERADLLRIHRDHFLPYVKANPDLILGMLSLLCDRLRWTSSTIEDAAFLSFPALDRACRNLVPAFPQRSPPRLLPAAACGGLRSAPDHRTRRALLHLSYSCAPQTTHAALVTHDPF